MFSMRDLSWQVISRWRMAAVLLALCVGLSGCGDRAEPSRILYGEAGADLLLVVFEKFGPNALIALAAWFLWEQYKSERNKHAEESSKREQEIRDQAAKDRDEERESAANREVRMAQALEQQAADMRKLIEASLATSREMIAVQREQTEAIRALERRLVERPHAPA